MFFSSIIDLYYVLSIYGGKYLFFYEICIRLLRILKFIKINILDFIDKYVFSFLENIII